MAYTGSVPDTGARRLDWMDHAACRGQEDIFDDPSREHEARTICVARCPVRSHCLPFMKEAERGLHRNQRDSVAAGLTHSERHRLDATAVHRSDDPEPIVFDGTERCGTHHALLRHLWNDEPIDSKCWSGEVRRDRDNRTPPAPVAAVPQPEPQVLEPAPPRQEPPVKGETPQERRIYRLWADGFTDVQIARRMAISVPAVQRTRDRLGLLPHHNAA